MLRSPEYDDARLAVLLELALQRSRALRRGQRLRRGITGAVALFLVAGLAGGFAAAQSNPAPGQQIQAAAYVTRVEHALASQGQNGLVGYARTVLPPGAVVMPMAGGFATELEPGTRSPQTAGVMIMWTFQHDMTVSGLTATGQPVFTEQVTATGRGVTTVAVNYRDATWWRATLTLKPGVRVPAPPSCSLQNDPGTGGWPAFIRQELSCGGYRQDGRQRVDGVDAIKLTGSNGLVLWINPLTYLPVREVDPGPPPVQTDFRWFRAAPASLAHLNVPVPAGFRQVPPPPKPVLR